MQSRLSGNMRNEVASLKLKLIESECNRRWEQLEHLKPNLKALGGDVDRISEEQEIYEDILKLIR